MSTPLYDNFRPKGLHFPLLADRRAAVPIVARWAFDTWGCAQPGNTFEQTCTSIRGKLNRDHPPLFVLCLKGDEVLGMAAIKLREMNIYPEREHWLGDVFVRPDVRGRGIATMLCKRIEAVASSFAITTLHLQTERHDGGLYTRLGWQAANRVHYQGHDVLVMNKLLVDMA